MSGPDRVGERQAGLPETSDDSFTVPVIEERLRVDKREVVTDHVVLRKTVEQRDAFVEVLRQTQDVSVERVPVNRVVAEAPAIREEGDA